MRARQHAATRDRGAVGLPHHRLLGLMAALVAVAIAATVACAPGAPRRAPIVLIVVDTLRADHMSLYGYGRDTTPRISQLASSGSVFEHAFSAAAWTLPGVASLLTGQWPSVHGAGLGEADRFNRTEETIPTLAELLQAAGYATGAVVNAGYLHPDFGFARGFESYDFQRGAEDQIRRADASVDVALEWVDRHREEPFFLLLHVFDVHRYYDAPEPVRGTFTDAYRDRYGETLGTLESRVQAERDGDLEFHVAAYDEEILFVDSQIGRLAEGLKARGIWDQALVILTADHGEAFREHGALAHGTSLHNEVMRVPLVMWGPRVPAQRWRQAVSTVDVLPTATRFAGIDEIEPLAGLPLWRLFEEGDLPDRLLFAENIMYSTNLSAVVSWPIKLIRDFRHDRWQLYDLENDLEEKVDLLVGADKSTLRLARALRREVRALRDNPGGQAVQLDEDLAKDLRALGYIR